MRRCTWAIASFGIAATASLAPAWAVCTPAAPGPALEAFIGDPAGWIGTYGKSSDLGSAALAVAATAVNANSPTFGKALGTMLGAASSDQGRIIGHALSGLERSCTDDKDPADIVDKKYISLNILPNLLSNLSANVAYGESSGPETTSTGGGGGGGGGGAGLVGSGLPTGGSNSGTGPGGATSTSTAVEAIADLGAGGIGATDALLTTSDIVTPAAVISAPTTVVTPPATIITTPGGTGSGSVSANQ